MIRHIAEAQADRLIPPLVCPTPYSHEWIEYGDTIETWEYGPDGASAFTTRPRLLLVLCGRCRQTPDEATKP